MSGLRERWRLNVRAFRNPFYSASGAIGVLAALVIGLAVPDVAWPWSQGVAIVILGICLFVIIVLFEASERRHLREKQA